TIPKSLLEVEGRPFIFHQLEFLRAQGIGDVVVCVGNMGDQIRASVGDGSRFGLRISYSYDGPAALGTGGAVRRALRLLGERFFIMYGDSYLPIDFRAVQEAFVTSSCDALMTVLQNRDQWDKSNVAVGEGKVVAYDKVARTPEMTFIDYGLSIF